MRWERFVALGSVLLLIAGLFVLVAPLAAKGSVPDTVGLVDPSQGRWYLRNETGDVTSFFFGNPGDYPFMGDWDCDGVDTPGLYRQSDGFVYLRNSNTTGPGDISFFLGNPGDIPIAGDFDGNGCDTLSVYRPSQGRVFITDTLGQNGGIFVAELDYYFGNPGDKPFVGDFDGDGIETIGLHRESTGFVYFRNTHTQGVADKSFFFGNPGDRLVAGDWGLVEGIDTPAVFRPSGTVFYFRHTNTEGNADSQFAWGCTDWLPVEGRFGLGSAGSTDTLPCPVVPKTFGNGIWAIGSSVPAGRYRMVSDGTSCYWERLSGFSGQLNDIIANSFDYDTQIVDIAPTDAGFRSSNCNTWSNNLTPRTSSPTAPFGAGGHYQVGSEVAAGTWQSSGPASGDSCYWERLSGFSGELDDIVANGFTYTPSIVTISASDVGFYADPDCGTWSRL